MSSQIVLPRILQIGAGASKEIGKILASLGCSNPLIVTDKMMVQLGYVAKIQAHLERSEVYDDTVPEPTESSILGGVEKVGPELGPLWEGCQRCSDHGTCACR